VCIFPRCDSGLNDAESRKEIMMHTSIEKWTGQELPVVQHEEMQFAIGASALGLVLVATSAKGICAIALGDDARMLECELRDRFPRVTLIRVNGFGDRDGNGDEAFAALMTKVIVHIEAPATRELDALELDVRGTAFQQRVWEALREIPAGSTASYAGIATQIGAPGSSRPVAQACAANPLAVAIPCHRVVRSDGALSGYRWGLERKRRLLARERAA
jgi:AraC family transcriptional regulator of adaptative response/methylated-DNA-[protein]-cysteine methyltransferase